MPTVTWLGRGSPARHSASYSPWFLLPAQRLLSGTQSCFYSQALCFLLNLVPTPCSEAALRYTHSLSSLSQKHTQSEGTVTVPTVAGTQTQFTLITIMDSHSQNHIKKQSHIYSSNSTITKKVKVTIEVVQAS